MRQLTGGMLRILLQLECKPQVSLLAIRLLRYMQTCCMWHAGMQAFDIQRVSGSVVGCWRHLGDFSVQQTVLLSCATGSSKSQGYKLKLLWELYTARARSSLQEQKAQPILIEGHKVMSRIIARGRIFIRLASRPQVLLLSVRFVCKLYLIVQCACNCIWKIS